MKFPQIHLFVDSRCPALTNGQLQAWLAPGQLIAMIWSGDQEKNLTAPQLQNTFVGGGLDTPPSLRKFRSSLPVSLGLVFTMD